MSHSELQKHIAEWSKHLRNSAGLSRNTINSYTLDIKLLLLFLKEYKATEVSMNCIQNLTKNDVRSWFLYRRNKGDTTKTISRSLSSTKNFFKYLCSMKLVDGNDIIGMRPPKIEKSLPRPLSINQINDILETVSVIKQADWIIKRDRTLLALIYSVGLRITEALSLNREDVINSTEYIKIVGKGGKERMVPVIDSIKSILIDYVNSSQFPDSIALFVNKFGNRLSSSSIQKLVKKSRKLLNLSDNVTPHALRHSCATHLMEGGGDLRSIQELLGHSSISSTQIYTDVTQRYISDVYDRCHPLAISNEKTKKEIK
jgi:integrase/recombinase XerC